MVCPVGSGKMAVLARLLQGGSLSRSTADEVGNRKSLAQYIHNEFCEADEANLLDEEDMHVFGLKPMTDQLHLVCCNACRKPINASQYMAHAEMCRLLNSTQGALLELNGTAGSKKPPKKDRKKSTNSAKKGRTIGDQETSELVNDAVAISSEFRYKGNAESPSLCLTVKGNSAHGDIPSSKDDSRIMHRSTDDPASQMPPPIKRSKLIAGEHITEIDDREMESATTRSRDFQKDSVLGREVHYACAPGYESPLQLNGNNQLIHGAPMPLATKIYYSQRNNRLRSAIRHLYYMTSTNGIVNDLECRDAQSSPLLQEPEPNLRESSVFCSNSSAASLPPSNASNHLSADAALKSQNASVQLAKSNFFPQPFSFTSDPGKPLSVQQPDGSVPVS